MTPLSKAAEAELLVNKLGYSARGAAKALGVSDYTVRAILKDNEGWELRKNKPVYQQYLAEETERLKHVFLTEVTEAMLEASNKRDKASYLQLTTGACQAIDKFLLLSGKPTEIHASVNLHAVADLDKLASMLGQSLVNSNDVSNLRNVGDNAGEPKK